MRWAIWILFSSSNSFTLAAFACINSMQTEKKNDATASNMTTTAYILTRCLNWCCLSNKTTRLPTKHVELIIIAFFIVEIENLDLLILSLVKTKKPFITSENGPKNENQGNPSVIQGRANVNGAKIVALPKQCGARGFLLCSCHLTRLRNAYRKWTDKPFLHKTFSSAKL